MDLAQSSNFSETTFDKRRLAAICAALLAVAVAVIAVEASRPAPKIRTFGEDKAVVLQALEERKVLLIDSTNCAEKAASSDALFDCLDKEYEGRQSVEKHLAPLKSRPETEAEVGASFL